MFSIGGKLFHTSEIQDNQLRVAAEVVDQHVGKTGDRVVTKRDLRRAGKVLSKHDDAVRSGRPEKSPLSGVTADEVAALRTGLDQLGGFLHSSKQPVTPAIPHATSLSVQAIADPQIERCGKVIAEIFGCRSDKSDADVNLSELATAKKACAELQAGTLQQTNPDLATTLSRCPEFTMENILAIEFYMRTGKGGLVNCGPMRIGGKVLHEVYRLPMPVTKSGAPSTAAKEMKALINRTESMLERSAFDRVYVIGRDNRVYLALNRKGDLNDIQPNYLAQMGGAYEDFCDAGVVNRVVDVANSFWREAVLDPWKELVLNIPRVLREKVLSKFHREANDAVADGVAASNNRDPEKIGTGGSAKPNDPTRASVYGALGAVGVGVATAGVAAFNSTVASGVAGGLGGLFTISNILDYLTRKHDMTPIYHAMGVAVNRPDTVIY